MKPHVEISRPPCLSEVHNPKMVSSWVTPISQPSITYYHLATLFREVIPHQQLQLLPTKSNQSFPQAPFTQLPKAPFAFLLLLKPPQFSTASLEADPYIVPTKKRHVKQRREGRDHVNGVVGCIPHGEYGPLEDKHPSRIVLRHHGGVPTFHKQLHPLRLH
ncbi:hypothetical protein Fmac_013497 [Flemingia macrophylla]|uniref:Uncharacterized protein n=1 Tax=Flemingia macrophylla TaxID=520843 RepID=A0ABD1MTA7_9FABA